MKRENTAKVLMAVAMFIFGTLAPFVRNIDVSSGELALYRAVLAAILVGGFLLITKQKLPISSIKKELILLVLSGIAMGVNWIFLFEAYKYTTVSVATLSYYFAPVIVTVACPLLFKEKMTLKQWICFAMSTVGIVLITGIGDLSSGESHLTGILCGLGAAMFYATVILLNKFIKNVEGIHRTFLQFIAAIAVLIPYVLFTDGVNLGQLDSKGVVCLLIVGLFHTGVIYCLYFSSIKALPGQKAALLSYIDPLVAVIISVAVLQEAITPMQLLGGAMILGFTLWSELSSEKSA